MAIKVGQAFERTSAQPIDTTLTLTKTEMLNVNDNLMPSYYFTICQDDGKIYLYDKTAAASVVTGKFKKFEGGSGGSGAEIYHTTATLSETINDTTVVLAADLPGVTWTDLEVGKSIIRDDNGTWGIVTSINGTTDVTVTSATTSTPTVELTQAQYDALVAAGTVDDRTIYFVTDAQPVNQICYVGSKFNRSDIYDTEEKIIGSYMGKPLYQKTVTGTVTLSTGWNTIFTGWIQAGVIEDVVTLKGVEDGIIAAHELPVPYTFLNPTIGDSAGYSLVYDPNYATSLRFHSRVWSGETKLTLTVQYTKTTDPAGTAIYANENDYSTNEHIIGTWTDGKPLYQKTIYSTLPATTTDKVLATSSENIGAQVESVAGYEAYFKNANSYIFKIDCNRIGVLDGGTVDHWVAADVTTNATPGNQNVVRFMNSRVVNNGLQCWCTVRYTKVTD